MTSTSALTAQTCRVGAIDVAYFERGRGPLVLCLHGFPDTAYAFEQTLTALADAGFRAVAPFLRGYAPSSLAPDGDYSMLAVAGDILGLIDALGEKDAIVVGHDWGGLAAYTAANLAPQKIRKLVVMNVPHVAIAHNSWIQLKKSWYVFFFQLPWWPEKKLVERNFRFIDRLYRDWSPGWKFTSRETDPVKQALSASGGVEAALGYYRAMVRGSTAQLRRVMTQRTLVPSMVMAGVLDGAIDIGQFDNVRAAFGTQFHFKAFAEAGHFPHRECFDEFISALLPFLKDCS